MFEVLTTATHDFLSAIQEKNDLEGDIKILVGQINIAGESDGLNGEIFTENGWIKFVNNTGDNYEIIAEGALNKETIHNVNAWDELKRNYNGN